MLLVGPVVQAESLESRLASTVRQRYGQRMHYATIVPYKKLYFGAVYNVPAEVRNSTGQKTHWAIYEYVGARWQFIFEFDATGQLASHTHAASAQFGEDGASWMLEQAQRSRFHLEDEAHAWVERTQAASLAWPTHIKAEMVSATLRKRERMTTLDLFEYIRHLKANGQTAQRYEIELGRKVFYPLSCLVMVVLALPFAYLHFRSGNITGYVFIGVLVGISFFLLNNVFGFIGNLRNWEPWLAAAAPGVIYSVLSLAAFGWLVLRQ